jgi:hypothetical protein
LIELLFALGDDVGGVLFRTEVGVDAKFVAPREKDGAGAGLSDEERIARRGERKGYEKALRIPDRGKQCAVAATDQHSERHVRGAGTDDQPNDSARVEPACGVIGESNRGDERGCGCQHRQRDQPGDAGAHHGVIDA